MIPENFNLPDGVSVDDVNSEQPEEPDFYSDEDEPREREE